MAPVIVPVYRVAVANVVPGVSVNVAIVCVASRVTAPVALTHGAAHVTVMLAVPVSGATGSFSVAVTSELINTPVAPLSGVTAVTAGLRAAIPLLPRTASLLQPAASAPSASAIIHARHRARLSMIFMRIPWPCDLRKKWQCWSTLAPVHVFYVTVYV